MSIKLLFVDDDPAFGRAIKQRFKKETASGEYEIIFARSGEEALEHIERDEGHEIDLLLTDLKMPGAKIDGFQLIRTLAKKAIPLKTVVISAYGDMENYTQALRENVLLFITKPIEIMELKSLIEEALKKPESITTASTKVNFKTLSKLVNELPPKQKQQLIYNVIGSLKQEHLEQLQEQLPLKLQEQKEINQRKIDERNEMIARLRRGEIDPNTPLLDGHFIEERYIPADGKSFGPYYYLRWWEDGKLKTKYLGKHDPRKSESEATKQPPPEQES
ncbi:MAG: Regulator of RpoS [Chroococcopsis gigantea SAG 12.99]|jgi:YesN/AraC family two-component response regulator|nr:response regulator [Chlorogloea purpurea SAG 13.99]MDV3001059.1 Regulator of RpoS [Chroococcopsis gigantea SAG 12.99]